MNLRFFNQIDELDNGFGDDDVDSGLLVFHEVTFGDQCSSSEQIELHVKDEIERYLRVKPTSSIQNGLKDYPIIRSIFMKFNCIQTSEAICERMFSYAGNFFFDCDLFVSLFVVRPW